MCWVILIYTVIQAVHSLLYIVAKYHFFSVVTWKGIIKYLQKCEGCTHFCEILYHLLCPTAHRQSRDWNEQRESTFLFGVLVLLYFCKFEKKVQKKITLMHSVQVCSEVISKLNIAWTAQTSIFLTSSGAFQLAGTDNWPVLATWTG